MTKLMKVTKFDMAEKLLKRMDQISLKIQKLDAIGAKINKLDSIEEKIEKIATKLSEIENLVVSRRCEFNASKEKHADLQHSVDEIKESVDFAHSKVELLELKAYKTGANLKEAREELQKSILYLEAYSRRANLKFAGIPEVHLARAKKIQEKSWQRFFLQSLAFKIPMI